MAGPPGRSRQADIKKSGKQVDKILPKNRSSGLKEPEGPKAVAVAVVGSVAFGSAAALGALCPRRGFGPPSGRCQDGARERHGSGAAGSYAKGGQAWQRSSSHLASGLQGRGFRRGRGVVPFRLSCFLRSSAHLRTRFANWAVSVRVAWAARLLG